MRTVKTAAGAVASCGRHGAVLAPIEHLGSAHDEAEVEALKAAAQQQLAGAKVQSTGAWMQPAPAEVRWRASARGLGICGTPCVGRAGTATSPIESCSVRKRGSVTGQPSGQLGGEPIVSSEALGAVTSA